MTDKHQRDPRLDAVQTSAGSAPDAGQGTGQGTARADKPADKQHKFRRSLARILTGIAATLLIVFCSWSLAVYLQGGDPLLMLSDGSAVAAEGSIADASSAGDAGHDATGSTAAAGSSADGSATTGSADETATEAADADNPASAAEDGKDSSASSSYSDQQTGAESGASASAASGAGASSGTSSASGKGSSSGTASSSGTTSGTSSAPAQPVKSSEVTVRVSAGGSSGKLTLAKGSTVYDALLALGVSVNAENTEYGVYVTSINGVAEDANHGWTYTVNGSMPNVSASGYRVSDGDSIVWTYVTVK